MLSENVDGVVQVNVCRGNVVDGERSSRQLSLDLEVGTQRMANEYCSAFSERAARIRLRSPTLQSILSLYGDLTKLLYLVRPVEVAGSMLLE